VGLGRKRTSRRQVLVYEMSENDLSRVPTTNVCELELRPVETTAAKGVIDCEKDGAGQELSFAGGEHTPIPTSVRRSPRKV
jgi:hypothetical protein